METKIMLSTEKGIKAELLKGRKASIEVAKRIHSCIEKWEETDSYKNAKEFLIDRLGFNQATISKYNRAVDEFSLSEKDSPYNTFAISTLCELLRIGRDATDILFESGELTEETTQAEVKSIIAIVKKEDAESDTDTETTEADTDTETEEADTDTETAEAEAIKSQIVSICVNAKMNKAEISLIKNLLKKL